MKMTGDDQKKTIAIGGFVLLAVGILYYELSDSSAPSTPPPVAVASPASTVARPGGAKSAGASNSGASSASMQLDPTLKMGPMLVTEALVYSGSGRNIFSASSVPVDLPKPIAPPRPVSLVPAYVAPSGPPPPPPIDLKFFGTATSGNGSRQAFLLHGEDVFLASAGDIVQRRYKVISVAANSIVIEDMTNSNRQTLPLLTN